MRPPRHFGDFEDCKTKSADQVVQYTYDHENRWVRKILDSDGDGDTDASTVLIYDGNQILLRFDHCGAGDAAAGDLKHRHLWGPQIDQLLADEQVTSLGIAGSVVWPLGDHLNTVRDLATYDSGTDSTTIANHRVFDAFGKAASETNSNLACLFAFTGRPYDVSTALQNNLNRWFDPHVGR